jgi:hypothetical protein
VITKKVRGLSRVGILGQIVTFVGAGEVRSGVGTLASPMVGRCEAAGEQDAGRPKGSHPSSLPPPPLRDEPASLLVSQNTYPGGVGEEEEWSRDAAAFGE